MGLNSSHTPCNDLYTGQREGCDGQSGFDQSPAPPPHVVRCLMSGRWLTPDWRESDVSVTIIMQEMRKHTAERRRTLSHGPESRAVRGVLGPGQSRQTEDHLMQNNTSIYRP